MSETRRGHMEKSSYRRADKRTSSQKTHPTFFVDDSDDDAELVAVVTVTPPQRRSGPMPFGSMIPDDTDSESSSSSNNSNTRSSSSGGRVSTSTSSTFESSSSEYYDDDDVGFYNSPTTTTAAVAATVVTRDGTNSVGHENSGKDPLPVWNTCVKKTNKDPLEEYLTEKRVVGEKGKEELEEDTAEVYSSSVDTLDTIFPHKGKPSLWDFPRVFFRVLLFCDCYSVCRVMLVCRRFHQLAAHDTVWRNILNNMNLQPLLVLPKTPKENFYRYFIDDIITTRALHGQYCFEASSAEETWQGIEEARSLDNNNNPDEIPQGTPFFADDFGYPINKASLIISPALLGQMNHPIGRVQLLIEYKDKKTEVIHGAARFSWHRRCFVFCCTSFVSGVRGHVLTVAISTVRKQWCNQSAKQFEAHKGGLRLIMTPTLLEGIIPGSGITETDIVSVSSPLMQMQMAPT